MLLDLPDVRQTGDHDCGAACLAVLFEWYDVPRPRWVRPMCDPEDGLQPDAVRSAVRSVLGVAVSLPMTVGVLRGFVLDGRPVLCPVMLPGADCGHWVVVRGVTRARVSYHCPENGRESLPLDGWLAAWRDEPGAVYQQWGITGWRAY